MPVVTPRADKIHAWQRVYHVPIAWVEVRSAYVTGACTLPGAGPTFAVVLLKTPTLHFDVWYTKFKEGRCRSALGSAN